MFVLYVRKRVPHIIIDDDDDDDDNSGDGGVLVVVNVVERLGICSVVCDVLVWDEDTNGGVCEMKFYFNIMREPNTYICRRSSVLTKRPDFALCCTSLFFVSITPFDAYSHRSLYCLGKST